MEFLFPKGWTNLPKPLPSKVKTTHGSNTILLPVRLDTVLDKVLLGKVPYFSSELGCRLGYFKIILFRFFLRALKVAESLGEDSLVLTTRSPGNPRTDLINLRRMTYRVTLGAI